MQDYGSCLYLGSELLLLVGLRCRDFGGANVGGIAAEGATRSFPLSLFLGVVGSFLLPI